MTTHQLSHSLISIDQLFMLNGKNEVPELDRINQRYLEGLLVSHWGKAPLQKESYYWNAERFGLQYSTLYKSLSEQDQRKILELLSHWNLSLSYYIETSGGLYSAKMLELSENKNERAFYSIFAHDELVHQQLFTPFMQGPVENNIDFHPLLRPLGQAILGQSKAVLIYIVQVLLEGFGLAHYQALKEDCRSETLKNTFGKILADEARHHGAGLVMRDQQILTSEDKQELTTLASQFIRALQDADWIRKAMTQVLGPLSSDQNHLIEKEINRPQVLEARRQKLAHLIKSSLPEEVYLNLERSRVFDHSAPKASV